ncbi:MAG: lytic transglycosylase domain-containing protein [Clostridia bacterium]|nr:lytic transglycosylase domain-containing protein [Clostridia bacterium]
MRIQRFLAAMVLCTVTLVLLHSALRYHEMRAYPLCYEREVTRWAEAYGVPEPIVYAVIRVESRFDPAAVSPAGAKGLMQLTDITFEWIRSRIGQDGDHVFAPDTNIQYGVYYLSYLYGRFGDWPTAFAAYNAGPNRVAGWIEEYGSSEVIPYPETREYLVRVEAAIQKYEKLYFLRRQ